MGSQTVQAGISNFITIQLNIIRLNENDEISAVAKIEFSEEVVDESERTTETTSQEPK